VTVVTNAIHPHNEKDLRANIGTLIGFVEE
jgi:hypothetical protein